MFFKTKRNPRKTTRQTLSTEQLEPKAMFSVSPVEPVVALDVGPVNQAGYDCQGAGTCSADGFMKIGDIKGEVKPTERVGNDGRSIVHPQYNVGEDGRMIVHPQYNVGEETFTTGAGGDSICSNVQQNHIGGIAGPDLSTSLRSDNRFVFEIPKNDSGISLHASVNPHAGPEGFMKLGDIKGEFRQTLSIGGTAGPGGSTFMTDTDGRMIVHPQYNVGEDGRMIVHPQYNVGEGVLAQANQQPSLTAIRDVDIASESVTGSANPGGDDIFMPKPNRTDVWTNGSATSLAPFTTGGDGRMIVHPQYNVGEDGRMIVHPQYNDGEETLPTGTIISYEDSHLSAKDLIGNPPEPKIAPPAPHVSDRAAVIDGGSDSYTEVEWTYFASRQEVFARMGR